MYYKLHYTSPSRRFLVHLPSVLNVCQQIREVNKYAAKFLAEFTSEDAVLLALLADAGDEGLSLVRQVDSEDPDAADVFGFIEYFRQRVETLFMHRKVTETCGYTHYCLQMLRREDLILFTKGAAQKIVCPSDAVLQRCLVRMQAWARLQLACVKNLKYSIYLV